ncbi:MAG: YceI family protein [Gammaproteobacteria bacterium]|nr:MAG: YceI family protein [Gammaproteobacteria bacterium]
MFRIALTAALLFASASLHATTYILETHHTQGVLRWNHLGFSNPTAQFSRVEGTLEFDATHPLAAAVSVTIPLANLNSGLSDLDDDLRSASFFDTAKFPVATFKSTKVEKGAGPNQFKVSGELNVHGVTRPVALDVVLNKIGVNPRNSLPSIGFEATTTLKRSEFGLGNYVPQVSDEVQVHITTQADEAKSYAQRLRADATSAQADAKRAAEDAAAAEAVAAKVGEAAKDSQR